MNMIRILLVLGLATLFSTGCGPKADRCAKCGMLVDDHPRTIAGAVDRSGKAERFCCPRCMFVWLRGERGEGARDIWITEYYKQQRTPIDQVFFVMGSDVTGPMGKDLVPVAERTAAERFLQDHHGSRILQAGEITTELLKEIIGKPHSAAP
jgi:nitrous oxide reductase accessory protein NosL